MPKYWSSLFYILYRKSRSIILALNRAQIFTGPIEFGVERWEIWEKKKPHISLEDK